MIPRYILGYLKQHSVFKSPSGCKIGTNVSFIRLHIYMRLLKFQNNIKKIKEKIIKKYYLWIGLIKNFRLSKNIMSDRQSRVKITIR